ncbi:lipid III flippase WzxE [Acerihabitans sp. KWT182]|uniref:Lipid III flippase n=1 Tax=Acerihabitans sp. KWT182 TaxID=3157919 RepID=A0AAU7Q8T3_9GAMM
MSLAGASLWTAASTLVKIGAGLLVVKLLAVAFGPGGVGQAGNFRQLVTVLGVLSGAGIFNGITKHVAQCRHQPEQLSKVLGTGSCLVLGFSTLLALVFLGAAGPVGRALFGHDQYRYVIYAVAFIQLGIAYANLMLAVLKGFRDAAGNALAVASGSVLGAGAYFVSYYLGGYQGALAGLALVPAATLLPAAVIVAKRGNIRLRDLRPAWDRGLAAELGKFTLMALMTSFTLPVAYILMRNLLARHYSWAEVGIWQGVSSISDAYLQFITASFTVYLLPTLARLTDKRDISKEIGRALLFVLPAVAGVSLMLWLSRDIVIRLLLSAQFEAMRDLFAWQLIGDVLKVGAYVFGYLVIAKASLRFYLLTEVSQFALLTVFSRWLIPLHGALGAAEAYMATYIVYFLLCASVFTLYTRKK